MSDGEDCRELPGTEGDTPSPSCTDNSPDVAPTRKARRKPEQLPLPVSPQDAPLSPELERQNHKPSAESGMAPGGWGYWGSWGKSLISSATATVATVGQGLSQVMEKAETSLGIPSPTELSARVQQCDQQNRGEGTSEPDAGPEAASPVGSAMEMLSSLSSVVQSTGKTVISGGLDALEFIGKKTMDVIAEGDPGFKKTKGLMIRNSTLSQVLREAKECEEMQMVGEEEEYPSSSTQRKAVVHYGVLFDHFQGLSHLEALEILSRESKSKVKSVLSTLSGDQLTELRVELQLLDEAFALLEFDDDEEQSKEEDGSAYEQELVEALNGLHVSTSAKKLHQACQHALEQVDEMTKHPEEEERNEEEGTTTFSIEEVHAAAISRLAELTARSMENFHKVAEMLLFSPPATRGSAAQEATALSQVTLLLCKQVSLLSKRFSCCLTAIGSKEKADVLNPLITGIFLEASNSASYIQDAFQLLLPVLQVSHIQGRADPAQQ